jgi:hypothetical protein
MRRMQVGQDQLPAGAEIDAPWRHRPKGILAVKLMRVITACPVWASL